MRTSNTFGVSFVLRKNKANKTKSPIYVRINLNKDKTEFVTKLCIEPKFWNAKMGMVKTSNAELSEIKLSLEAIYNY